MTATLTRKPTSRVLDRRIHILRRDRSNGGWCALVRLAFTYTRKTEFSYYRVSLIPSDWGMAFAWAKLTPDASSVEDVHHVNLANEQDGHCDCRGHEAHGHCKHYSATKALVQSERL